MQKTCEYGRTKHRFTRKPQQHSNTEIKTLKHVIGKVVKNRQLRYLDSDTLVTLFIR